MIHTIVPLSALLLGCFDSGAPAASEHPNAGLLRDFLDGKYDAAGHPVNGKVIEAEAACGGNRISSPCTIELPEGARSGELVVNVRMQVHGHASFGTIATITLLDEGGREVARETLTVSRLRGRKTAIDVPITLAGSARQVAIAPAARAVFDVDYVEVFPKHFKLVAAPGSGVYGDRDSLAFELPAGRRLDRLDAELEGGTLDLVARLDGLVQRGVATRVTTAFRTIFTVRVGDLLPERGEVVELRMRAGGNAARTQLRRSAAECRYAGDASAPKRVLVTGFQPFPADGRHDNVSAVAVGAMNPFAVRGAAVMKLILPVEYDRAAAAIADVIERCAPDVVISFGQGGGAIALEQTAYNLQDTGEIAGGAPDNRGIVRAAQPIDQAAEVERDTLLPLAEIRSALEAIGEAPADSDDPGRYICNNVMFSNVGVMSARGGRAGFIHLPVTTEFDDATRARFGRVVEAVVQATIDAE